MKHILKWHIYLANLDPVVGSEQGKSRPVLVISENDINSLLNCVNVIPITSFKPNRNIYPNEIFLPKDIAELPNDSIVLCHQIRTIDKQRLLKSYGDIGSETIQNRIFDGLRFQFGM